MSGGVGKQERIICPDGVRAPRGQSREPDAYLLPLPLSIKFRETDEEQKIPQPWSFFAALADASTKFEGITF